MDLILKQADLTGTVQIPASKSVAHRAYICAALAAALSATPTDIICNSDSIDIQATRNCLNTLSIALSGQNLPELVLDCRESGSTLRFLLPLACVLTDKLEQPIQFTGADYLAKRPLSPLLEELCAHGADIRFSGSFPLIVSGGLTPGSYTLPGNISSQYISGLLLALPLLSGDSEIHITGTRESVSYIGLTLDMQRIFGIRITETDYGYFVPGNQTYLSPGTLTIEADWSSAAFWLAAGAIGPTAPVLTGLSPDSAQGDRAVLQILESFGAKILQTDAGITLEKPTVLHGTVVDASDVPDLIPVLAVVAAHAEGKTEFINAGRLRIKESDRIVSTEELLQRLGVRTESTQNTLTVYGTTSGANPVSASAPLLSDSAAPDTEPIAVRSFNDHRIAMSAAVAATVSTRPILLSQAEAVCKSYPTFYEHYKSLGGRMETLR